MLEDADPDALVLVDKLSKSTEVLAGKGSNPPI